MHERHFVQGFWVTDKDRPDLGVANLRLYCECPKFTAAALAQHTQSYANEEPWCDHTLEVVSRRLDKMILEQAEGDLVALWTPRSHLTYPVHLAKEGDSKLWRVGVPLQYRSTDVTWVGYVKQSDAGRDAVRKMLRSELAHRGYHLACIQCDRADLRSALGRKNLPAFERILEKASETQEKAWLSRLTRRGWWLTYNELCENCSDDDLIPKL